MATLYEGRVHVTDISDRFKKNPTAKFKKGDFVRYASLYWVHLFHRLTIFQMRITLSLHLL